MKKIAADLDGTLLDSCERHRLVLSKILSEKGIRADLGDFVSFKREGFSTKAWLRTLGLGTNEIEDIAAQWISKIEDAEFLESDKLMPETIPFLEKIRDAGASIVLITARKNREGVFRTLRRTKISEYFDAVHIVPAGTLAAAKKAEILKKLRPHCFVGDTEADALAAELANVPFYALNGGFRSKNFWDSRNIKSHTTLMAVFDEFFPAGF